MVTTTDHFPGLPMGGAADQVGSCLEGIHSLGDGYLAKQSEDHHGLAPLYEDDDEAEEGHVRL